jgi:hypothetical protein
MPRCRFAPPAARNWQPGSRPFRSGLVDLNRFWRDEHRPEKAWQYDLRRAGFYTFTTGKVDSNYQPMPEDYRRILFHEEPAADDRGRARACTPIWIAVRASRA